MFASEPTVANAADVRGAWHLRPGVTYLNHGSFGPSPLVVQQAREAWSRRLEAEPMDFFVRTFEADLAAATTHLGSFVGAAEPDLLFVPNATVGMNLVAANLALRPGDEVLLTNHEYGAVQRIWRQACKTAGAQVVVQRLPEFLADDDEITAAILQGITPRTRLIVVSHITSPTAVILPVQAICAGARGRGVAVCIDGPHAPAMVDLDLTAIGCDYYCASLHKWVSAPFGSGFLYVSRQHQTSFRPQIVSWGGSLSGRPACWKDEFTWSGTYDPAVYLAVPAALDFLTGIGLPQFRAQTHALCRTAWEQIVGLTGLKPFVADSPARYGSMIALPLPAGGDVESGHGRPDPLQVRLWETAQIEAPIVHWGGRRFVRVSCHLYNTADDVTLLADALRRLL